jgi:hypothetical protein
MWPVSGPRQTKKSSYCGQSRTCAAAASAAELAQLQRSYAPCRSAPPGTGRRRPPCWCAPGPSTSAPAPPRAGPRRAPPTLPPAPSPRDRGWGAAQGALRPWARHSQACTPAATRGPGAVGRGGGGMRRRSARPCTAARSAREPHTERQHGRTFSPFMVDSKRSRSSSTHAISESRLPIWLRSLMLAEPMSTLRSAAEGQCMVRSHAADASHRR